MTRAHREIMRILAEDAGRLPAVVLHCFSGSEAMAAEAWSREYFIGVAARDLSGAGVLRRYSPVRRATASSLKRTPLSPADADRESENEPAYLRLVVERLATLWMPLRTCVGESRARNTCRAFGIPLREAQG